ncbi:TlpA family protein disulfide reductase [Streptomyces sp. NPDC127068]|uniref:TlpA family protein disulfide reductase n=1 Tax=Streptomyces sp. NPDC127068 TaxID=3347127 RepID=UPI003648D39D
MDLPARAARPVLPALGAVLAALALTACSGAAGSGGGGGSAVDGLGIRTVVEEERPDAPELRGETLDGERLDLGGPQYAGKVVVVNVWGSWCVPCRAEAKHLVKAAERTEDRGVAFVGINTRDPGKGPARAFEEEYGVPYPSFYDPAGKLLLRFPKGYLHPQSIPSTVVIDRNGKVAASKIGDLDERHLRRMIDPLLTPKR